MQIYGTIAPATARGRDLVGEGGRRKAEDLGIGMFTANFLPVSQHFVEVERRPFQEAGSPKPSSPIGGHILVPGSGNPP